MLTFHDTYRRAGPFNDKLLSHEVNGCKAASKPSGAQVAEVTMSRMASLRQHTQQAAAHLQQNKRPDKRPESRNHPSAVCPRQLQRHRQSLVGSSSFQHLLCSWQDKAFMLQLIVQSLKNSRGSQCGTSVCIMAGWQPGACTAEPRRPTRAQPLSKSECSLLDHHALMGHYSCMVNACVFTCTHVCAYMCKA